MPQLQQCSPERNLFNKTDIFCFESVSINLCSSDEGAAKESKQMKSMSFKKCSESVKRKADLFDIPTLSKKLKTENWNFTSSTENLILDFWKRDVENTPPPAM